MRPPLARLVPALVASALAPLACNNPTPPTIGTLVIRTILQPALSGTVGLDSAHVILTGPVDTTIRTAPGDTVAIKGLPAGSYTVTLVGFKQGSVLYFGVTKNVQVGSAADTARVPFSPPVLSLNAGNNETTATAKAVPIAPSVIAKDSSGDDVAGVSVSFAVASGGGTIAGTNPVATNASGIATVGSWTLGSAPGTNTLTATAAGLTGSPVTFTATDTGAPPPPATWPNDPYSAGVSGWYLITDYGFTDPLPDGSVNGQMLGTSYWVNDYGASIGGGLTKVLDVTAPNSTLPGWSDSVLSFNYANGFIAGVAPATLYYYGPSTGKGAWYQTGGTAQTYMGFWFKHSSNWFGEASCVGKMTEFFDNGVGNPGGATGSYFFEACGTGTAQLNAQGVTESIIGVTRDLGTNVNPKPLTRGVWHLGEVLWTFTGPNVGNVKYWVDSTEVMNYTGITLGGTTFNTAQIYTDWGGGGDTLKTGSQQLYFAHIRITGHP